MVCVPVWQVEKLRLPEQKHLAPRGTERKRWSHGKRGHRHLATRINIPAQGETRLYSPSEALQQTGGLSRQQIPKQTYEDEEKKLSRERAGPCLR